MTDDAFDAAIVAAAFELGAERGWAAVSGASACQRAGLDLAVARLRFPTRLSIFQRFGEMADARALTGALAEGLARDRLFDILLRRFDVLQAHRPGVLALLKRLPLDPALAIGLAAATLRSMGWMLEGAGLSAAGTRGAARAQGLLAVWAWGMRAWVGDESADLTATMAAIDVALNRAEQIAARYDTDPGVTVAVAAAADMDFEKDTGSEADMGSETDVAFTVEPGAPPDLP